MQEKQENFKLTRFSRVYPSPVHLVQPIRLRSAAKLFQVETVARGKNSGAAANVKGLKVTVLFNHPWSFNIILVQGFLSASLF